MLKSSVTVTKWLSKGPNNAAGGPMWLIFGDGEVRPSFCPHVLKLSLDPFLFICVGISEKSLVNNVGKRK